MADYDGKAMSLAMRGGTIADEKTVLAGMDEAAKDLARDVESTTRAQSQNDEVFEGFNDEIIKAIPGLGDGLEKRLAQMKALEQADRKFQLPRIETRAVTPRVFTGSIGGVETPGYDYRWTHNSSSGPVDDNDETADRQQGEMSLSQYIDSEGGAASMSSAAAIGFYFRPSTETGLLKIEATPAYEMALRTWNTFSNSKTRAWLGFNVGEYQVGTNARVRTPVRQKQQLGSLDHNFGVNRDERSSTGYGLSAQFPVDNNHWYAIWVWCGIVSSSGGNSFFTQAAVISDLSVSVPSVIWTLY